MKGLEGSERRERRERREGLEGLGRRFRAEREKVRALGLRAGAAYIWQYYWLWIAGILLLLGLGLVLLVRFLTTPSDLRFYLTLANTREAAGTGSALWEGYVSFTGYDPREGRIVFNAESYFDYGRDQGRGNPYYQLFTGLVDAGVLDAVTMEPEALTALGSTGRLLDLEREDCAALRRKYAGRLLYALPLDAEYSAGPVPIGIDISDSVLVTEYHLYSNGCALGIGAETGRLEAVEAFLDYIYREGNGT